MEHKEELARLDERVRELTRRLDKLEEKVEEDYVRKEDFKIVRAFVYGLVGTILSAVLVAILNTVVHGGPAEAPPSIGGR